MGITTPLDGDPGRGDRRPRVGVSPLEMADAYATLASGGIHHNPVAIERVVFPDGKVDDPGKPNAKRVLSEAVAYEVTRLLHDNITEAPARRLHRLPGRPARPGPPTTTPTPGSPATSRNLATAVWVGYPNRTRSK